MTEVYDIYGSGFDNDDQNKPLSVLQAKRVHNGLITVLGTIVSVSEMYILEVQVSTDPNKTELRDARSIQLEDTEKLDENEHLDVVLYDDMITDVAAGEVVRVRGQIKIERKRDNGRSKKKINVLHAISVDYVNRKEVSITPKDIKNFCMFASYGKIIQRLVSMTAPNVIGYNHVKEGLLRATVGGVNRGEKDGGRNDTLLVGDPGTAKSTLALEVTKIKPNSRFVSAPHASTKTLTAIVDKDNDIGVVLRAGAIPLSRGAICAINEVTTFPLEDQSRLLDVLAEGKIPIDKHGRHFDIAAPTTIIATANPVHTTWSSSQSISNDEIMLRRNLIDRFTQIYAFRDNMTREQTTEFVRQMNKLRQRRSHNYNFLRKYLVYASGINVSIAKDAENMLNQFWLEAKEQGFLGIRMYYGLYKIAEAQAKLQLKDEVDEGIAKQTMENVRVMMAQYGPTVGMIAGPREATYNQFLEIIQNSNTGITVLEICRIACRQNDQVAEYIGNNWSIEHNRKLRIVVDMLVHNSNINVISQKPTVLKWLSDKSDISDMDLKMITSENTSEAVHNNTRVMSDRSDRSDSVRFTRDPFQSCPYCGQDLEEFYGWIHLQICSDKAKVSMTAALNKNNLFYAHRILVNHLSQIESR